MKPENADEKKVYIFEGQVATFKQWSCKKAEVKVVNESKIDLTGTGAQIRPRHFPFNFIWKLLFAASIQFLILHHTTSYIQDWSTF